MLDTMERMMTCLRGDKVACANSDAEAWLEAFVSAWSKGYNIARACEAQDAWIKADTIITLVSTQTGKGEVLSVTLERVSACVVGNTVVLTVSTHYTQREIVVDTAHTEVWSKGKMYFDE